MALQQKITNLDINDHVHEICSEILVEFSFIADSGYPEQFKDLFMEQLFVCGLNGFKEFLHPAHLSRILGWQKDNCFLYDGICNSHTTGLGIAIYGLLAEIALTTRNDSAF